MDLDVVRVIKSIPKDREPEELAPLMTPWGEALAADHDAVPLAHHPRPQLARERTYLLNGWWQHAFVASPDAADTWRIARPPQAKYEPIRVPFSPEAPLSGVGRQLQPDELLWYRRRLAPLPLADDERCILHFDGVDHACAVYLGGHALGVHEGAYQPFSFDVTQELRDGGALLEVCVFDPSDTGTQQRGKQRLERGGMWYTAQSGIWQSVWLEVVPQTHVDDLRIVADPDAQQLRLKLWLEGSGTLTVDVVDAGGDLVARGTSHPAQGVGVVSMAIFVRDPQLWAPGHPYLYQLRISYGDDVVRSYCAFRTVGVERDEDGVARLCLNHRPIFCRGLLDQGYWPDGLMTAPSDDAMVSDLQRVRDWGFNMVRKHVKVEPERWYWHCDRMGILVWQDMPNGGDNPGDLYARDLPTLFKGWWHAMRDDTDVNRARFGADDEGYRAAWTENMASTVSRLSNHPCVMAWVLFNESWGQFDASLATQLCWELDPTRPVISTSGWYDQGCGDVHAWHNYFRGIHMFADPYAGGRGAQGSRAQVMSECGGYTWYVDGHSSLSHAYGYAAYESAEEWRAAVDDLLAQADALEAQGLSGFVYTQVSDVEEETNGFVTYDRRVDKLADL